ncbi:unnamed protein product [Rotaria sp. Silwood2]|nr:unnamed protein product [Rotaria sp. Silwood2]
MFDVNQSENVIKAPEGLLKQSEKFHKQILIVVPEIHCAIGYSLANCMLIEENHGNILIDTLESRESAREVKEDLRQISSKAIVAIIYTHYHADHVFGADVFAEDNIENIQIYSHSKTLEILDKTMNFDQRITFERAARQFGTYLNKQTGHINCGIGPFLKYNQYTSQGFFTPTHIFNNDTYQLSICGREFTLYYCPGETDDHIVIHMSKENVLFATDNIYKSFPNFYAIRGTTIRDSLQ